MQLSRELLQTVEDIAVRAGQQILEVYGRSGAVEVSSKVDDSPLTEADLRANKLIVGELMRLFPQLPILSEESDAVSFAERMQWSEYWLVDPLDGTKEFISRNGEFTVNIALIRHGQPVLGVVHVPVTGISYVGFCEGDLKAAYVSGSDTWQPIAVSLLAEPAQWEQSVLRVVASRRHGGEQLESMLADWRTKFRDLELLNMGSSLKICLVAEGKADIYPRFAPTSEWDTAAAHAVLRAAGGEIVDESLNPLTYNQKESILNPSFIALAQVSESSRELFCGRLPS
jgi:3'(2'), 5'-bisphosphate nucleotidase